ncbi:MAG TPA: BACON domain-containing carbohydrate-binding protein [Alistipes sp.]|uniref:BACON domain-containing protein n=1 Tax=Alistipes sp. TaxID=1872444 RepID=UPI002C72CA39|nr:BACON domain-containing carbohydrate-binding protein [Alistipes sp.]HUN14589.1 BACON domain-containing carbohydrate-binding protein [Alistipes sp.]
MKKYLILLASAMLAWSCGDDKNVDEPQKPEPPVTEASISLSATEYAFAAAGGTSDEITVTSSGAWELIGDDKVFEPSAKSGENGDKVTFTVGVNPKSEERTGTFQFLCDGEIAELTLTQSGGDELTIETREYAAPVKGGSIYVEVKASGAFEYTVEEGADWLTKPTAASAAAATPERAELVAAANDTGKARQATVTFTLGELSVPVVVTQVQNDVLKVAEGTDVTYNVGKPAETVSFAFEANFKPVVTASADWITVGEPVAASAEEGVVAYTLSIEVAANDGEPRNGTVTIAHPENGQLKLDVAIKQDGEEPLPEGAVRIPDANFRTKLLALGYIESADSEICKVLDDGTTIPMMNVSNSNIADLTGIEVFTNIATLNVSGNPLARLDLSKNPNITNLSVNNVQNLTYADLGEMNLSWFDPRNLKSTSLTVISRGNVKELEINGVMTEIDLSQCYNITTIKLNGCSSLAGTVDLRNCAAIKNLGLNLCSKLEKVILPKSVEGQLTPTGTYNENLVITYE